MDTYALQINNTIRENNNSKLKRNQKTKKKRSSETKLMCQTINISCFPTSLDCTRSLKETSIEFRQVIYSIHTQIMR